MDFRSALHISREQGLPIKRKTQTLYGIIIDRGNKFNDRQIVKFVDAQNIYPLDLEDILANDWEVKSR